MIKKNMIREKVYKDLLEQMERQGAIKKFYIDLINDYMAFWDMKDGLQKDIQARGTKVPKLDSKGQQQLVNNESMEQALKVNKQMLQILDSLNLQPSKDNLYLGGEVFDL